MVTVSVAVCCGIPAGNGGTVASATIFSAAASSSADPALLTTETFSTRPDLSAVNRSPTLPSTPRRRASSGYTL